MSDEVGGYYAELKLITDGASFERGRRQLEDFTRAGERAVAVFNALNRATGGQRQIGYDNPVSSGGGNYAEPGARWVGGGPGAFTQKQIAYNGAISAYSGSPQSSYSAHYRAQQEQQWRYAGNNFGQGGGGRMHPPRGGVGSDEDDEEDKNEKKKSALTRVGILYALVKAVQMLERFTKAMWDLTGTTAKAISMSTSSATMMGMGMTAYTQWKSAIGVIGGNPEGFESSATNVENAYRNLRIGDPALYSQIAKPMAMLGLNLTSMSGMNNDARIRAIINAALKMYGTDPQKAIAAMGGILGSAGQQILTHAPQITSADALYNLGTPVATPTGQQIGEAQNFSKLQNLLDNLSKLLGNTSLDAINKTILDITNYINNNQDKIQSAFEGIGKVFNALLKFTAGAGEGLITAADAFNKLTDKPGGLGEQFIRGLNPFYFLTNGAKLMEQGQKYPNTPGMPSRIALVFNQAYKEEQQAEILKNVQNALAHERAGHTTNRRPVNDVGSALPGEVQ